MSSLAAPRRNTRPASAPGLSQPGPGLAPVPHPYQDWAHPAHICAGTGLYPATSAPGPGLAPVPHPHQDWARPPTSAPGLGSILLHPHQDLGSPRPHPHRDWAHPAHIRAGTQVPHVPRAPAWLGHARRCARGGAAPRRVCAAHPVRRTPTRSRARTRHTRKRACMAAPARAQTPSRTRQPRGSTRAAHAPSGPVRRSMALSAGGAARRGAGGWAGRRTLGGSQGERAALADGGLRWVLAVGTQVRGLQLPVLQD
jgi:hypothetical protein